MEFVLFMILGIRGIGLRFKDQGLRLGMEI